MKSSNVEKSVWLPHVEILKNMKNHLEKLKKSNGVESTSKALNGEKENSATGKKKQKHK